MNYLAEGSLHHLDVTQEPKTRKLRDIPRFIATVTAIPREPTEKTGKESTVEVVRLGRVAGSNGNPIAYLDERRKLKQETETESQPILPYTDRFSPAPDRRAFNGSSLRKRLGSAARKLSARL